LQQPQVGVLWTTKVFSELKFSFITPEENTENVNEQIITKKFFLFIYLAISISILPINFHYLALNNYFYFNKLPFLIAYLRGLNFDLQTEKKGVNLLQMLLIIKYKKRI
jgi:hypothetical protein